MRFDPQSDEQIKAASPGFEPWPPGEVDFEITSAVERQSSKGNDMFELTMFIFNNEGRRRMLTDYIVVSQQWKLKPACYSCGMHAAYDNGIVDAEDFVGRTGRLKIAIDPGSDEFPKAKNKVASYIVGKEAVARAATPRRMPATADLDDEIPF